MASANDPLRVNDVGTFGELSQRPNPDNLVILPVPPLKDFLPSLRQQLGRDLTSQEIEIERRKSPSIAVEKITAEKMRAERAKRSIVVQTEPAKRAPGLTQDILMLFTGTGDSLRFGDGHAVNYRLVLQVKEVESDKVVEEFDINREYKRVFYEYYGRWLNRFENHH